MPSGPAEPRAGHVATLTRLPVLTPLWWRTFCESFVNRRIASAMLTVAGAAGIVKVAALAKDVAVASQFGTGDQIDAFIIAFVLPSFVVGVISSAFQAAVIPAYVQAREREGPAAARHMIAGVILWSVALLVIMTGGMAVAAPTILPFIGSGFSADKLSLTLTLFYFLLPLVVITGCTAIWGAVLTANERFGLVCSLPVATPLLIILLLLAAGRAVGIYALPTGMIIGALLEAAMLARALRRRGLWVWPRWHGFGSGARAVMNQVFVMAIGAALMGSTAVIDQSMAAALDPGSVASLSYGQKLVSVLLGLSSGAMGTVVLPHFSGLAARGDWHALQGMLRSSLRWIALTATPVTVVLVWQSVAITHLMFQRNAFTPETAVTVGEIQALYAIQVPFYLMSILAARVISSMRANHLLMWGAGISLVVDITLNYVFMQWIGVKGIALSTTMVLASSFVFLWIVMSRRLRRVMATDRERLAAGKTLQQGDASRPF